MIITLLFSNCASTTIIQSVPSNADLYLNGELVGKTPYPHTDTKIVGSTSNVALKKDGYEDFKASFSRDEEVDVGAIIGGLFILVPFLWTMKYKESRTYVMTADFDYEEANDSFQSEEKATKAERLRELKELFEEGLITEKEYEKAKEKILAEEK